MNEVEKAIVGDLAKLVTEIKGLHEDVRSGLAGVSHRLDELKALVAKQYEKPAVTFTKNR